MKNLAAKLLLVQKELKPIERENVNPHFKSRYADINSVLAELRPILNKNGLVVQQPIESSPNGDVAYIQTRITDAESGEQMVSNAPLPATADAQKMGAAITYLRRYSLMSLFLLETEDDDGNSAVSRVTAAFTKPQPPSRIALYEAEAPFPDNAPPVDGMSYVPGDGSKPCAKCGKPFVPKFEWATDCYPCYALTKK